MPFNSQSKSPNTLLCLSLFLSLMWPKWLKPPKKGHNHNHSYSQSLSLSHTPTTPRSPFSCSSLKDVQTLSTEEPKSSPKSTKTSSSIFHRIWISSSAIRSWAHRHKHHSLHSSISLPPHDNQRIVLYFTSLRIVRKTFEDCRTVRSILCGFRVPVDERDLSMDSNYIDELQEIIGSKKLKLPIVFIGGNYVGGAEEIKEMHETGELKKLIGGLPFVGNTACDACGGLRFVVCEQCSGSHKIYVEKCGFMTCTACNINGLIRCSFCDPVLLRLMSGSSKI